MHMDCYFLTDAELWYQSLRHIRHHPSQLNVHISHQIRKTQERVFKRLTSDPLLLLHWGSITYEEHLTTQQHKPKLLKK